MLVLFSATKSSISEVNVMVFVLASNIDVNPEFKVRVLFYQKNSELMKFQIQLNNIS